MVDFDGRIPADVWQTIVWYCASPAELINLAQCSKDFYQFCNTLPGKYYLKVHIGAHDRIRGALLLKSADPRLKAVWLDWCAANSSAICVVDDKGISQTLQHKCDQIFDALEMHVTFRALKKVVPLFGK
jgi:hypothetical protein